MTRALVALIADVLIAEGGGPGNSLHSWRCEYPERYGPCDCVKETAEEIASAVTAHMGGFTDAADTTGPYAVGNDQQGETT